MFRLPACYALLTAVLVLSHLGRAPAALAQQPTARVFINGQPERVFFNDGDSFAVIGGRRNKTRARLMGFNTLESHGPAHQWGDWTAKELYVLAKMATLYARKGVWRCTTEGKRDGYGRLLLWCPDLAEALIARGLAHAMSVTDDPADARLLRAQRKAIAKRLGIWAHGVPPFVVTSIHSFEEDIEGRGVYNRLVSSGDGHSVKWRHENRYKECQKVCHRVFGVDDKRVTTIVDKLLADSALDAAIKKLPRAEIAAAVRAYARFRLVFKPFPVEHRVALWKSLSRLAAAGEFGDDIGSESSCMIHVLFKRRYGPTRAECLR